MITLIVWIALVLSTGVVCVTVIFAVRKPMGELLKANSYISPASKFYLRTFSLVLFLASLGVIVGAGEPCAQQTECFMQCVWWVANHLSPVLWSAVLSIGGYVLLVTILFAVLGRYHDE
jgi:uncharacterized transporter YbjL